MSQQPSLMGTFTTGNEELDSRLGGGIPYPSFGLIEGENGTAKTTLVAQFALGALISGLRVVFFTTETTTRQLLRQTRNITIDLTRYYVSGKLIVYSAHAYGAVWGKERVREALYRLLEYLIEKKDEYDVIVIDSLTPLLLYVNESDVDNFISTIRYLVDERKTVFATLHSGIIGEALAKRVRAAADVYFKISLVTVGGRPVKALTIVKMRGAPMMAEHTIAFDVDPAFGIKIVPIVLAHA
ncbi:MAG: ATPase domain-containing protein [Pyrodictiaceae archaeon]